MRLEPLCTLTMQYVAASWHQPYGPGPGTGEERLGFGQGTGEVTGDIEATVVWANYPRRREDGVWLPDARGWLTTGSGEELLLAVHGLSVAESAPGRRRAVTARVELTSQEPEYRWLNTCFLVGEGEIDEELDRWWLRTYVCVNEEAKGPPAIGAEPPERFRQRGSAG